jgi:YegS/Rv2252/BmrU family lipid kinase
MALQTYAKVIVNPFAGTGATGRKWPGIQDAMTQVGLSFDVVQTEGKGHAVELTREAVIAGYGMVIAVGGDGTLNEVVNGLVESGGGRETVLGILNTGTACDFARFLKIPRDYHQACLRLVDPLKTPADVGMVECRKEEQPIRRYFISAAGLGFDGEVVGVAEKWPRVLHGATSYFMGILESFSTYHNKDIQLHLDDTTEDIRICNVVIANGGFYASGMRLAPDADLSDGLFEVLIVGDLNKLEMLQTAPQAYLGTHIKHHKVRLEKAAQVIIESSDRILIQADGELVGEGPAKFRVLPSALNIAM